MRSGSQSLAAYHILYKKVFVAGDRHCKRATEIGSQTFVDMFLFLSRHGRIIIASDPNRSAMSAVHYFHQNYDCM